MKAWWWKLRPNERVAVVVGVLVAPFLAVGIALRVISDHPAPGVGIPFATTRSGTAVQSASGTGERDSPPFQLTGGDYTASFSATDNGDTGTVGCLFIAKLATPDGGLVRLGDLDVKPGSTQSDTNLAYGVPSGEAHFHVLSNCSWTVSIAQR